MLLPHWSNIKTAYEALQRNYTKISELARLKVDFSPAIDYKTKSEVIDYVYCLARQKIIEIKFKNNKPYSTVSIIEATKK